MESTMTTTVSLSLSISKTASVDKAFTLTREHKQHDQTKNAYAPIPIVADNKYLSFDKWAQRYEHELRQIRKYISTMLLENAHVDNHTIHFDWNGMFDDIDRYIYMTSDTRWKNYCFLK